MDPLAILAYLDPSTHIMEIIFFIFERVPAFVENFEWWYMLSYKRRSPGPPSTSRDQAGREGRPRHNVVRWFSGLLSSRSTGGMAMAQSLHLHIEDILSYLDLGRGGTPPTVWGFWRVIRLKYVTCVNVLKAPRVSPTTQPYRGRLYNLAPRTGPRPTVLGVAPQRQSNFKASPSTYHRLVATLRQFAATHPNHLVVEDSFLEGYLPALKRRLRAEEVAGAPETDAEFGGMIAHRLGTENVTLATNACYWRPWHHIFRRQRYPVPETLVFLYVPLHQHHYDTLLEILEAAIWWATRGELFPINEHTYPLPPAPVNPTVEEA
ncbi:hypothetical protein BJ170DRAFT_591032 [Xylariales sp. AK1849]|nr:hypothetical protein BJ170DRAFT_591032 [Xylariales sp. AK1849]